MVAIILIIRGLAPKTIAYLHKIWVAIVVASHQKYTAAILVPERSLAMTESLSSAPMQNMPGDAAAAKHKCIKCGQLKPSEAMHSKSRPGLGLVQQKWCKCCHSLDERMSRLERNGSDLSGVAALPMEEKMKLFQEAADLKGKDLETMVNESIERSRQLSSILVWKVSESFMDETDVKEHFKNKPEQLAKFFENTQPIVNDQTEVALYPVKTYTRVRAEEDKATETRAKELVHKRKLQAIARPQVKRQNKEIAEGEDTEFWLNEKKIESVTKFAAKLEENKIAFASVLLECSSPELKEMMPKATVSKATSLMASIDSKLLYAKKFLEDKKVGKEAFKRFTDDQKDTLKSIDSTVKQLNELLSDISEQNPQ